MQSPHNPTPWNTPPIPPPGPVAPGPSPLSPSEEKNWAVATHLASLCGYIGVPFGHILGPLVIWLMKKDSSRFLDEVGKETVNYNISVIIWFIVSFALFFTIIGIPLSILMIVGLSFMDIIVTVLAATEASNGRQYRYPLTIRFIS